MARPGAAYPQVEPGAEGFPQCRVAACRPGASVAGALGVARRTGAEVLVLGPGRAVRRRELSRAAGWSLGRLRAGDMGWSGLPVVSPRTPETHLRRLLAGGAPMILVREGERVAGAIEADTSELARPTLSVAHRLERLEGASGEARLRLLRAAGKVGEALGTPVFAVGGFVRDLLLGRPAPDVDLVVEGDGLALARRLAGEAGGTLVIHAGFGTASLEGVSASGGASIGRVDIATARGERYDAPGALPVVSAATVPEDLKRRDFSVNAMAVALLPSAFGRLLDPLGGQKDLARRRLRPLHPLSFVEDPTRIFRAARYACRLGLRLDVAGRRALRLALRAGRYPALSGQRLRAEVELLAAELEPWPAFKELLKWGALRLWDREYRVSPRVTARLREAARLAGWTREAGIGLDPGELALVALLLDQPRVVVSRCLQRLAVTGEPLRRLEQASAAASLARRLGGRSLSRPSLVAEVLGPCPLTLLAGAWLAGDAAARRRIRWFLVEGRARRPLLSGDEVAALGVPRGPALGECLAALRRLRLDGAVTTLDHERAFVKEWLRGVSKPDGKEA